MLERLIDVVLQLAHVDTKSDLSKTRKSVQFGFLVCFTALSLSANSMIFKLLVTFSMVFFIGALLINLKMFLFEALVMLVQPALLGNVQNERL